MNKKKTISKYSNSLSGLVLNLYNFLTIEKLKELLPDLSKYKIERFELPNINSLNFYIHDILEDGVSSNNRKDGQAKSLGEYLRVKKILVPDSILLET